MNTYILLSNIIQKYSVNENYQKRINIASFQEGCSDDEDVLEFADQKGSEILNLIRTVIEENVAHDLDVRPEDI